MNLSSALKFLEAMQKTCETQIYLCRLMLYDPCHQSTNMTNRHIAYAVAAVTSCENTNLNPIYRRLLLGAFSTL